MVLQNIISEASNKHLSSICSVPQNVYMCNKGIREPECHYAELDKKTLESTPFTSPSNYYASPSIILPHIPLQSSHSVYMNGGSDNHTIRFTSSREALSSAIPTMASVQTAVMKNKIIGTVHKSNEQPVCTK